MATSQNFFRFGGDSGNEATHGWIESENTNINWAPGITFLLRGNIQETGGVGAFGPPLIIQLYVSKNGAAYQVVSSVSSIVKAVASTALVEDGDCTQRLSGTGTFTANNDGQTETGAMAGGGGYSIAAGGCVEAEFALQIVAADVAHGDKLYFKFYANGALTAYPQIAQITVVKPVTETWNGVDSVISGRVDSPWFTASRN